MSVKQRIINQLSERFVHSKGSRTFFLRNTNLLDFLPVKQMVKFLNEQYFVF